MTDALEYKFDVMFCVLFLGYHQDNGKKIKKLRKNISESLVSILYCSQEDFYIVHCHVTIQKYIFTVQFCFTHFSYLQSSLVELAFTTTCICESLSITCSHKQVQSLHS